ncbi:MAG: hypothetical protein ACRDYA_01310 [Egibacteraceae bacterium]
MAVTRDAAYFTDSKQPVLYVVPLGPAGELPDQPSVHALPLPASARDQRERHRGHLSCS